MLSHLIPNPVHTFSSLPLIKKIGKISLSSILCASQSSSLVDDIKQAMRLSTLGQMNITEAFIATTLWEDILLDDKMEFDKNIKGNRIMKSKNAMSSAVKKLCYALYAASLVRTGRDDDALFIYNEILDMINLIDKETESVQNGKIAPDLSLWVDVKISRGETLQRLMKYQLARDEFHHVFSMLQDPKLTQFDENYTNKQLQSACKAALCSLRLDDLQTAEAVLLQSYNCYNQRERINTDMSSFSNVIGMLGVVQIEIAQRRNEKMSTSSIDLLKLCTSSKDASPVYNWFYNLIQNHDHDACNDGIWRSLLNENDIEFDKKQFSKISSINNSPFDDPFLINLDDKVYLHQLLSKSNYSGEFWPTGFILPNDEIEFREYCKANDHLSAKGKGSGKNWIIKERAGYGSHGNQIVSTKEATNISSSLISGHEVLCQKLIEPALCYEGRRFSLRLYVIYFPSIKGSTDNVVYISRKGLMKLALHKEEEENATENDIYMTNSGRLEQDGESDSQYDFAFLESFIDSKYGKGSFDNVWTKLQSSVRSVIYEYKSLTAARDSRHNTIFGSIPKIMGFDYLIDSCLNPRLIEVNRFPGLEARGTKDWAVKSEVVKKAWLLASERQCSERKNENSLQPTSLFIKIAL